MLKKFRKRKVWSQEELAKRANCGRRTIQRAEAGQGEPSLETILDLAAALEVDPEVLMRWSGPKQRVRDLVAAYAHRTPTEDEVGALPPHLRTLFKDVVGAIETLRRNTKALEQLNLETTRTHTMWMALADENSKTWEELTQCSCEDPAKALRLIEDIRGRHEEQTRVHTQQRQLFSKMSEITKRTAEMSGAIDKAARLDRELFAMGVYG